jgi:type IV fimbrial biogenesis protein FimT
MLNQRANRAHGFTLIEMAVTMGIFGLLTALAVPTMRTWISNTKVRAVCDALQNGLRLSQSESLRRSRQVVFELTNNTATPFTAVANGSYWAINTIPSMTDGTEFSAYVESGVLAAVGSNVVVTGPAAICFNSAGRLVSNTSTNVTNVTGGASCTLPTAGTPPKWAYNVSVTGSDRPLRVQLFLGGQVHMCDPSKTLSSSNPDGCVP